MDIRYAIHPDQLKSFDTQALRKHFLVEGLFDKNKVNMVYSHVDRIIVGGVCPTDHEVQLKVTKELGVDFFLQRREMGSSTLDRRERSPWMEKSTSWRTRNASISAWDPRR